MKPSITASLLATALLFGAATWVNVGYGAWPNQTEEGIVWLCPMLGISVVILTFLCLIADTPPADLPVRLSLTALLLFTGLFVLGSTLVTDAPDWFEDPAERMGWVPELAAEWAGFCIVLATVLFLPRVAKGAAQSRPVPTVADEG